MKYTSRRGLLSAGTGLAVLSAGCLDQISGDETDDPGDSDETNESDGNDLSPLERWVPASGSSELLFHYRDLTAVRQYEDALRTDVVESVPTLPDGESSEFVEQVADGEPAVDAVCRFGSKGVAGNVVVSGSFDPGSVDADRESAAGDFEVLERDGVSVAVSEETVVVSPSDGADLDAILAAGLEGTDRRIDAHGNFAQLTDRVGDSTFLWGEYEGSDDGSGAAFSWTLGAETATYSALAVYAEADRTAEFEETMSKRFDDVTVEVDGTVGVATRTVPTEEYEYRDLFAERGSQPARPQAGVSIDPDSSDRTVTVTYVSRGSTVDRLEISDESGNEAEMTQVGETMTFEYDAGASGELTVVAVGSETEAVVATYTYSF
ncbi:hypothetical protein [Natrinema versiforme]|uniref:Uncharacterized protein n=1 Tax=Natrinema versiforme TaxID=88724 RepID=A0A4P8WHH3_9EURY|nr:hypothetical protein [Natrinema versiforme]QCS42877.1 hypothetical protein FEJ81_11095 [Natrinema versiforme]